MYNFCTNQRAVNQKCGISHHDMQYALGGNRQMEDKRSIRPKN